MAKKKTERYAVTENGERLKITGENGRYWLCGSVQMRKSRVTTEEKAPEEKKPERESGVIDQEARA